MIGNDGAMRESVQECVGAGSRSLIGYARVSTKRQKLDLQLKALEAAGCDLVVSERLSGVSLGRGLLAAIGSCRRGDLLVVWKLDRLGRNMRELLAVLDVLKSRGIGLQVLTGAASSIDIGQAEGPSLYAAYAAFAEFELTMNRERTLAGIEAHRTSGMPARARPRSLQLKFAAVANRKSSRRACSGKKASSR
ncbi:recombinase family protein [Bosea caraganae]|nr:recombinase family protein [Bosea caraganae]